MTFSSGARALKLVLRAALSCLILTSGAIGDGVDGQLFSLHLLEEKEGSPAIRPLPDQFRKDLLLNLDGKAAKWLPSIYAVAAHG